MATATAPPDWATQQILSLCARAQVSVPRLEWYRGQDCGRYWPVPAKIAVSEGRDPAHRADAEITLLHELTHHLMWQIAGSGGHSPAFWDLCWRLYLDQGVALDRAVYGEFSYHSGAEPALRALGLTLDPQVEAAGAYGLACRAADHLEARLRRAGPHHPVGLAQRHSQLLAASDAALATWQPA